MSLALVAAVALLTALLLAAPAPPAAAAGNGKHGKKHHVHKAWPHKKKGRKPHRRLAKKLAKQIGPIKVRKRRHRTAPAADPARAETLRAASGSTPVVGIDGGTGDRLLLVRSFDIPSSDSHYVALSNYSWTYDNALATIAFVADRDKPQARQLLDQLALLQNGNGSFDFAFDVRSGAGANVIRSGAVAWVALAAATYVDKYGDKTYDSMIGDAVRYLLAQRNSDGLVTGGPDVRWVSTQHNLLTAELLRLLGAIGTGSHDFGYTSQQLTAARSSLAAAIDKTLLVTELGSAHFREGLGDSRSPLDVQSLGSLYLASRGDLRAGLVRNYILQPGYYIPSRSTPAAPTPVSGLRPFLDSAAPNVIWTEGTVQAQFALTRLGLPSTYVATAVKSLAATTLPGTVGPIGADRTSDTEFGEYQTWPTSAATSWLLMLDLENRVPLFD